MKAIYDLDPYPRIHNSYSYQHLYRIFNGGFCEGQFVYLDRPDKFDIINSTEDLTHLFIIDNVGKHSLYSREYLKRAASRGVKVVAITYDPSSLKGIDPLVSDGSVAGVILFDKSFRDRFKCKTLITDYIFHEPFIPKDETVPSNTVCIYGTIGNIPQRHNRFCLEKIDDVEVTDYPTLYRRIQQYNGVHVFTTSLGEDGVTIVHNNKAKPVEVLLCGRNPYCELPMSTLLYDKYLKSDSDIPNPLPITFTQSEIMELNRKSVNNVLEFVKNEI